MRNLKWIAFSLMFAACFSEIGHAKTYRLSSGGADRPVRVGVQVEVRGKLLLPQGAEKEPKALSMAVDGSVRYDERRLPDTDGRRLAVRYYRDADVQITIDGRQFTPELESQRRLIVVEVDGNDVAFRSPAGPLTRDELELIDVQANSLLLHRLLPDGEVAINDSWPLQGEAIAPLVGLDSAQASDVRATLVADTDGELKIRIEGELQGAADSVPSQIKLSGDLRFDSQRRQISRVRLQFQEEREISGGQPGIRAEASLIVTLAPTNSAAELADGAIKPLNLATASTTLIQFVPQQGDFRLLHEPRWRILSDNPKRTMLRLIDGGDVVAQGRLAVLKRLPGAGQLTLEAFQADVRAALKEHDGQLTQAEQSVQDGMHVLRVEAVGAVNDVPIQWVYLHASNQAGDRLSAVFTLETKMVERFQGADLALFGGLEFTPRTAGKEAGKVNKVK